MFSPYRCLWWLLAISCACGGLMTPVSARSMRTVDVLTLSDNTVQTTVASPVRTATTRTRTTGTRFSFNYESDVPAAIRTCCEVAGSYWSDYLVTSQPITVDVKWETMANANYIAVCSSPWDGWERNEDEFPISSNCWYPPVLVNRFLGEDDDAEADMAITLNTSMTWYTGLSGWPGNRVDAVTVMMHEIGHGLGISSSFSKSGAEGEWGMYGVWPPAVKNPKIYDLFIYDAAGRRLVGNYANDSNSLGTMLTNNALYWSGPTINQVNPLQRPRCYAPSTYAGPSSICHLDESTYPSGTMNSLMTPSLSSGEVIHFPGYYTLALLKDMGWQINFAGTPSLQVRRATAGDHTLGIAVSGTATTTVPLTTLARLTNGGLVQDRLTFECGSLPAGWRLTMVLGAGIGADITPDLLTGRFSVELPGGESTDYQVTLRPESSVAPGATAAVQLTAVSAQTGARRTITVTATNASTSAPAFNFAVGDPFTGYTSTNLHQVAANRQRRTFLVKVINIGEASDSFDLAVTQVSGSDRWQYQWFNAESGGTDITAQVMGGRWTAPLAGHAAAYLRLEVTPTANVPSNDILNFQLVTRAVSAPTRQDIGSLSARKTGYSGVVAVRNAGESLYTRVVPTQRAADAAPAVFEFQVENTGEVEDTYELHSLMTSVSAGWTVAFYDGLTGNTDDPLTDPLDNDGYYVTLAPGATYEFRAVLFPDRTVASMSYALFTVTLQSLNDFTWNQWMDARAQKAPYQPNLLGAVHGVPDLADGPVNVVVATGQPQFIDLRLRNDGPVADTIRVRGVTLTNADYWTVTYREDHDGAGDITTLLENGEMIVGPIQPGTSMQLRVDFEPVAHAPGGNTAWTRVTAHSLNDLQCYDLIELYATKASYGTHLAVRSQGTSTFVTEPTPRLLSLDQTVIYECQVINNSQAEDTFDIMVAPLFPTWAVQVWDGFSGGTEHTSAARTGEWRVGPLGPGDAARFRVAVTPPADATLSELLTIELRATSVGDTSVLAQTWLNFECQLFDPRITIRNLGETGYTAGPSRQRIPPGQTAIYELLVTNRGSVDDPLIVRGGAAHPGWTVRYFAGLTGSDEITEQMMHGQYRLPGSGLAPGATTTFRAEVTPSATVAVTETRSLDFSVISAYDARQWWGVSAETTRSQAPVTNVTLAIDPQVRQVVGRPISLTALALTDGPVEYLFRAGYKSGAAWNWTTLRNYATTATCSWTPPDARIWSLAAWARAVGSSQTYDAYTTVAYTVVAPVSAVIVGATPRSPQPVGTPITLTASPVGGAQVLFRFRVGYKSGSIWQWTTLRDYAEGRSIVWTPSEARLWSIAVYAKESGSTRPYDVYATVGYLIYPTPPTAVALTATPTPGNVGTDVLLQATPTGGTHVQYWFRVGRKVGSAYSWQTVQWYSDANSYRWTPTTAGTYILAVYVKEVGSIIGYQCYRTVAYTVRP
jgi:hypothetical protein